MNLPHWHLLVVDDEPANREIIGEYLANEPFALDFAACGEEALAILETPANTFDAIILDRMMPGIDGIEVLHRLKRNPRYAHTPVIMQTAAVALEQVRQGLAAGAYYYLTKPYLPKALLGIVWAALDDLRQRRDLMAAVSSRPSALAMADCEYAFATLEEAERLASLFAAQCAAPQDVAMGLAELMVNAVEHGNLGISYQEKSRLKRNEAWREEVERRLRLSEYSSRRATIRMDRGYSTLRFTIKDEGSGFDWHRYLVFDAERVFDLNGRGIALARQVAFVNLEYLGEGNIVVATAAR